MYAPWACLTHMPSTQICVWSVLNYTGTDLYMYVCVTGMTHSHALNLQVA